MTDLNNPETIEIHGLRTISKLCHFGADNNMEGCTFTEIVEHLFAELEKAKAQAVPEWILVDDKWPEYGQSILVVINGLTQTRVFYRDGSDCSEDWIEPVNDEDKNNIWWNKVTFWMPLPKAPSKSGAEG